MRSVNWFHLDGYRLLVVYFDACELFLHPAPTHTLKQAKQ
jgi:hypothetical protein